MANRHDPLETLRSRLYQSAVASGGHLTDSTVLRSSQRLDEAINRAMREQRGERAGGHPSPEGRGTQPNAQTTG